MNDWITTANGIIALVTGLVGLIGTGVGAFFAVKATIKALKEKSAAEIWAMVQSIADNAMQEAERSVLSGADKKQCVINIVKSSCKTAGVNLDPFIDQLSAYIDDAISFANGLKAASKTCVAADKK